MIGALLIFVLPVRSGNSQTSPVTDLRLEAGRSFGYALGDLIRHTIRFTLDKPYRLEKGLLPHEGPLRKWLELRAIDVAEIKHENRTLYRIDLVYQIFPFIRKPETREIPGLPLRIYDGHRSLTFDTPATTVTISPLIPEQISDAAVKLRPEIKPAPISLTVHWRIFGIQCTALAIVLGYLAWRRDLLPFLQFRKSPFASARKELRRWRKAKPASPEYRNALLAIHRALNETAGETIFASGLERFFYAHPAFAPLREKTGLFFVLSQQVFFIQTATFQNTEYPVQWLEQLCREYHKIERSAR